MIISKGKMRIELEDDIEKLNSEIQELRKIKEILINSFSYKLLYGKTQMLGEKEEIRARLEHSQNISQIAQKIVEGVYDECATEEQKERTIFNLNKTKELLYTDIASLAHDLGHTPFGHNGERSVNVFMQKINDPEQIEAIIQKRRQCFGEKYEEQQGHIIGNEVTLSFEHNEQSALIFYNLLHHAKINPDRVDEKKMIDAILSHSTTRVTECPKDLVSQVVRHTDKIEYRIMDFKELGKYIKIENLANKSYAKKTPEQKIEKIVKHIVKEAINKGKVDDNMMALEELRQFRKEYEDGIYFLEEGRKGLLTSENIERERVILSKLLEYYYDNPNEIHTKYFSKVTPINSKREGKIPYIYDVLESENNMTRAEKAVNLVLSMDNQRIKKQYKQLVRKRVITGKGIEPVTLEEIEAVKMEQEEERIERWRAKEVTKTAQPHTRQEVRNIIRAKDAKFIKEMLTPEGKQAIENTRKKIEEDATLDRRLYEQMKQADEAREQLKRNKLSNNKINCEKIEETLDSILGKLPEEEKKQKAKMNAKEKWQQQKVMYRTKIEEDAYII